MQNFRIIPIAVGVFELINAIKGIVFVALTAAMTAAFDPTRIAAGLRPTSSDRSAVNRSGSPSANLYSILRFWLSV